MDNHLKNIARLNAKFPARNEHEMIRLFAAMLFAESPIDGEAWQRPEDFSLSETGKQKLRDSGIIQRMFRRWFQTTWGLDSWSKHFSGETPRQEIARRFSGAANGEKILTVKLSDKKNNFQPEPVIFPDDKNANFFTSNLAAHLAPRYNKPEQYLDFGFEDFFYRLLKLEKDAAQLHKQLPGDAREKYFGLFWNQAGVSLALNCGLDLSKAGKLAVSAVLQDLLTEFFMEQSGEGRDNFLITDELFCRLWSALRQADPRLLPFDKLAADEQFFNEQLDLKNPDKNFVYSEKLFYQLGVAFDRDVLFPLDLYFGAAEVVWQEQENFIGCLGTALSLLNGKLNPLSNPLPENDPLREVEKYALNITQLWFVPPSFFRIFPWAMEAIKNIK